MCATGGVLRVGEESSYQEVIRDQKTPKDLGCHVQQLQMSVAETSTCAATSALPF